MPVGFSAENVQPERVEKLLVTRGLEGQDDNIDQLQSYFKEMQKATVETLTPDDLLSFASCAHYFSVVSIKSSAPPASEESAEYGDEDAEGEPEEATEAVSESAYPASSRATSPPTSSVASNFSIISPSDNEELSEDEIYSRYTALPEQEKVLKWREAFLDKLEEADDEPIVPPTRPDDFLDHDPFLMEDINSEAHTAVSEDPDNYINWPEDSPEDRGHVQMVEDIDHSQFVEFLAGLQVSTPTEPVVLDKEFGREYLEPEQYDTPAPEPPEIPTIPKMDAFIYEESVKYRDRLRALRVAEYERKQARRALQAARPSPPAPLPIVNNDKPIGLIYLWTSQTFNDPLHVGECSLGFYFAPEYRKKEYLADALNTAIAEAFNDQQCHRLQSIVVENDEKLYTLELLSAVGFRHEGTRRRAFFSSVAQEWKDVTYFAMLATEWVYDNNNASSSVRLRSSSLWDEILTRHQRELDEMHRLEEKTLKRSTSTETIRQRAYETTPFEHDFTDSETQSTFSTGSSAPSTSSSPKRRKVSSEHGSLRGMELRSHPLYPPSGIGGDRQVPPVLVPSSSFVQPRFNPTTPVAAPSSRRRKTGGLSFSSASSSSSSSSSVDWVMLDD